jgi:hypothetical protein
MDLGDRLQPAWSQRVGAKRRPMINSGQCGSGSPGLRKRPNGPSRSIRAFTPVFVGYAVNALMAPSGLQMRPGRDYR